MKRYLFASLVMLAGIGGALCPSARGRIISYVDARGGRIYTNLAEPARSAGATPRARAVRQAAPETARSRLEAIVENTAARHGLDARLVRAVVRVESGWNPAAVSSKGAEGLMQLIPGTAGRFGVADAFDPAENVEGGVRYLSDLLAHYRGDLEESLAAYYAGEQAVARSGGIPNDPATRAYVHRVTKLYFTGASERPRRHFPFPIRRAVDVGGRVVYTNE
jgi:soluble lytic murein transglycosylase-like protein